MIPCMNQLTFGRETKFEEDLKATADAGFKAIEISPQKLAFFLERVPSLRSPEGVARAKELLNEFHLEAAGICGYSLGAFSDSTAPLKTFEQGIKFAGSINTNIILIYFDRPPVDMPKDEAFEVVVKCVKVLAQIAEEADIRIALEPLARHPIVPGPKEALKIVREVDSPSLGIMMDTFHYFCSGVRPEEVKKIPVDLLLIVHINDCEGLPLERLTDKNRLYPGEGIMPLVEYLAALREINYQGYLSVELFREEYRRKGPEALAKRSYETLMRFL